MKYIKTWNLDSSDETLEQAKLLESLFALAKLAPCEPNFGWDNDKQCWYWNETDDDTKEQSINFTTSKDLFLNKALGIIQYRLWWSIESINMQLHRNQINPWK